MSEPYLGEIRMVGFPYAPDGWANADGQTLDIESNQALYSLYGTLYGGDGRTNFKLPDFRGRVPIHEGKGPGLPSYEMGAAGGQASVVLAASQAPAHTHPASVHANTANGDQSVPTGHYWAAIDRATPFSASQNTELNANAVQIEANSGGGQPHQNMQPYLTIRFCVSLTGIYPPRP